MTIKVFLADDHTVLRDSLSYMLNAQSDITVVGDAANGREAVQQVQRLCPDVVIMDITMPDLNGTEATRQIRQLCSSCQVIILSMHSTSEHIYRALDAGASGYVLKESAAKEVVEAVRTVHAGFPFLSKSITATVIEGCLNAQVKSPLDRLTDREREVLQLVVEGKSSAEIAERLYISPKSVDTYRSRVREKLEISDLPSLVKFAIQHGLTTLD